MRVLVALVSTFWITILLLFLMAEAYVIAGLWVTTLLVGGTYLERWLRVRCDLGDHDLEYYATFAWCRRCETGFGPF